VRTTYRVLAWILALEVVVQAAAIAWALFGLTTWIMGGGVLDAAAIESEGTQFDGVVGFMVHGMNGTMIVPAVALLLLIVSFFAKVPGGVKWALIVFGVTILQYLLAFVGRTSEIPALGALHGLNALVLFGVAVTAAMRVKRATPAVEPVETATVA
jgi:hypothetical protein